MRSASAPGKLVLAGEYAVLEGAPALVTAVRRSVYVHEVEARPADAPPLPPEVVATLRLAGAESLLDRLVLDVSALRLGEHKLGLGSSAAAAAATAKLVLGERATPEAVFALAFAGHRVVAPEGSGIDVAASSHGGTLVFERTEPPTVRPVTLPAGLWLSVVFTGASARTSELVARVNALRAADPAAHASRIGAIARATARAIAAVDAGDAAAFVAALGDHGRCMAELGHAAGAPIVEARLARLAALADEHGGAAKPSGAGGGDVAVAAFTEAGSCERFERAAEDAGFVVVDR